jgi:hypothetical protein
MRLFGKRQRETTNETIELLRAVRHIADAITSDEPVDRQSAQTVERVIDTPVRSWEGLLREPRRKEGSIAPCRP